MSHLRPECGNAPAPITSHTFVPCYHGLGLCTFVDPAGCHFAVGLPCLQPRSAHVGAWVESFNKSAPGAHDAFEPSVGSGPAPEPSPFARESSVWVALELDRAIAEHASMNSAHEGYAVILEELDELWDEVKAKNPDIAKMRKEALQVAAMALRFIVDVCDRPGGSRE